MDTKHSKTAMGKGALCLLQIPFHILTVSWVGPGDCRAAEAHVWFADPESPAKDKSYSVIHESSGFSKGVERHPNL